MSKNIGNKIKFKDDSVPFNIITRNDNYIICSRNICKVGDEDLINDYVLNGSYIDFESAFEDFKDSPVYAICDVKNNKRSSLDRLYTGHDFFSKSDMIDVLNCLESGEVGLSKRNIIELNIEKIY